MNITHFTKYLKNPGLLNENTLQEVKMLVKEYPAFDLGWAILLKNLKNLNMDEYEQILPEVALRIWDRKWLKKYLEFPSDIQQTEKIPYLSIDDYSLESLENPIQNNQKKQAGKMTLIENFLANGGKFERKSESNSGLDHSDLSEKASEENDDIVTETFANILFSQGNYEKAIEAFKKLSLKFPEKSIYFAARIEEIQFKLKR